MRYATPERLLERLTDLRFLSIDFLNTFLLTYKVFTDGVTVLQALKRVYYDAEPPEAQTSYPTTSDVSLLVSALPAADAGKLSVRPLVVASVARRPSSSPPVPRLWPYPRPPVAPPLPLFFRRPSRASSLRPTRRHAGIVFAAN